MTEKIKFKYAGKIYNVMAYMYEDIFFVVKNSLPNDIVPKIGDRIIWNFEGYDFVVKKIVPLTFKDKIIDDDVYSLKVDLIPVESDHSQII